ncbi:pentapeptide repeat-containing protein [Romboutsia sp. 1001713B170207_170306_H8]|uniref:pentapeptide repeat-containing protein n=1 Tax=Romboutsia sp. 1001713B170207_170306_H8 TaxID=2787112 RepID=UPI0008219DAD|nr:pentapeptide repeat-containing protein [Romboutsia sp. 1001713B170207_170306_H8]SCI15780.1 Uncharacterized protein conserved in bacteria [uncultured Clostridium sp.]
MNKKTKIQKPKILNNLYKYTSEEVLDKIFDYETVEDALIEDDKIHDISEVSIRLNGCVFRNVVFENCDFRKIDMVDVIFENCDLSNIDFSNSGIYRVEFINCKLVGSLFNDCILKSVVFKETMGRYLNLAFSKFKGINIINSDFSYSVFQEVENEGMYLENSNLIKTVFTGISLNDVDFTTSNIDGIELRLKDVQGGVFSVEQALDLTKLMGIVIR